MASPATRLRVRAAALGLVVIAVTMAAWLRMRGIEMPATSAGLIAILALASALGGLRVGLLGALAVGAWIILARSVPGAPLYYLPADRLTVIAELAALVVAMMAGAVTHRRGAWLRREWWQASDRADAATSRIRALRAVTDPGLSTLPFDDLLRELLSRIRKHLAADYATVLEMSEDDTSLKACASDGLPEEVANEVRVSVGEGLSGRVALAREAAAADDLAATHGTRHALRNRFTSLAAAPLLVEGRVLGVLEIGTRASRHFTEDDIRLLQLVADRVATAIAQARLLDAERGARGAAVEAQHRYRDLVEGIDAIVWEADAATQAFTFVNRRAEAMLGWPQDLWLEPGAYLRRIVHPEDAERVRDHLARVAVSGDHSEIEYRALSSEGRVTWVREMVYVARDPQGHALQLRGVLVDISKRKRAERRLAAQFAVTQALAESSAMSDAAPRILRGICDGLGWDLGLHWAVDTEAHVLRCVDVCSVHGEGAFEEGSRAMTFERGTGIPGRAWDTAAPLWIPDVLEFRLPRSDLMARAGLHAALAFPLIDATGVVGVMEFLSTEIRYPDDDLLQMAHVIGSQTGQFLERRRAELAVRESEARTRAVIDAALECVISIDASGRITEWNPAAVRQFGWTREQAVGQEMAALIVPHAMRDAHRAGLRRYVETGEAHVLGRRLEMRALRADGTEFPVELTITRVPMAGPPSFTGYLRDISDRKRAEESQRVLNEASRVLASTLDGDEALGALTRIVVPTLADWCVVDMIDDADPERMRRVAVAHADPAKADRVLELSSRDPIALDAPSGPGRVARTGAAELVPLASTESMDPDADHDGQHRGIREMGPVSYLSVPIEARHRTLGVLTLVSAESRRRYGQEELALAQDIAHRAALAVDNARLYEAALVASRAKSDFLAVMSHELRTPLNAIIGYAELLLMGVPTAIPPQTHGHVQRIRTASRHLLEIVEEILTFSRMEAGREALGLGPADAVVLVRDTVGLVEPMAREKGLDFVTRVPNHAIAMETDAGKVRQILLNLLSNAVKFTEHGRVELTLTERDSGVVFVVEDTGIGISQDNAERVFEPFWQVQQSATRQVGGTGLGLSVARRLSRLLGGDIVLETAPEGGSRFTVTLPLRAPVTEAGRQPRSEGRAPVLEARRAS